jgi:hypothetical protein
MTVSRRWAIKGWGYADDEDPRDLCRWRRSSNGREPEWIRDPYGLGHKGYERYRSYTFRDQELDWMGG